MPPAPTERSRSINSNDSRNSNYAANEQNEHNEGGLHGVARQFEDALQEEAPGTTLFDILMKRPGAVIVALSLFALLLFMTEWISAFRDPAIIERLLDVPQVTVLSSELTEIKTHQIATRAEFNVLIDYDRLDNGTLNTIVKQLGQKIGSVALRSDGPISVKSSIDEAGESVWKHVVSVNITDNYDVSIIPNSQQTFSVSSTLTDVGQTSTLSYIVSHSLADQPVDFQASGTAIVSKYGIDSRMPFKVEKSFSLPHQTNEDSADVSGVEVNSDRLHGLNVTAFINATLPEFALAGKFPQLTWEVKIPGCDDSDLAVICEGTSMPFELRNSSEVLDVYFSSIVENLPKHLTQACDRDNENSISPLDRWITSYLAGELSTFYIRGKSFNDQYPILNELTTGYDIPSKIHGKPATEKLIQSVSIEEVRFGGQGFSVSDTIKFNGKAIVDVVLPSFIEMKTKTASVVNGVRGNIQLFDENKKHFAQVLASEQWSQTISLGNADGYKVICFFDDLPMEITDNAAFAEVSRDILSRGKSIINYDAVVDVNFETTVGPMVIKKIRIKGTTEMRA